MLILLAAGWEEGITLEGPRQVVPMRQLDRHSRAIVSLVIVSPLT